jgi:hypothetical protein
VYDEEGRYLKRIVIEANSEGALSPMFEASVEGDGLTIYRDSLRPLWSPYAISEMVIRIPRGDWQYSLEFEETDKFKKLASAIGGDLARKALEALGKPVPAKWDEKARSVDEYLRPVWSGYTDNEEDEV